ncbi:MAG TPA: hypothetical protein VNJ08_11395 [Bacteriovoracaceae bacterium]|nr:hypothetical protein [Bacteriovoracaceae bacterium]
MSPLSFIILLFPIMVFAQAKDDKFACSAPDPEWALTRVAQWAEEMDNLGTTAMRSGKTLTKFGNPIDESCFKGLSPENAKKRLARIEAGIGYAMTQAQRCWSNIGFAGTTGIIPKLRRTNINCSETKFAAAAKMGFFHSPTCDHKYELVNWGNYMDTAPMRWVGSTLFHEALHWSVANNRSYHNQTHTRNRKGCDKSLYEDRVYLMEAACFPRSDVGAELYDPSFGAANCPGVCEKGLTEADSAVKFNQAGGEALYGHNHTPQEAKIICDKIRDVPRKYEASRKELKEVTERFSVMKNLGIQKLGDSENGKKLRGLFDEAFMLTQNAYDPNTSLEGVKKNFASKKVQFISQVKAICGGANTPPLQDFCKDYTPEKNPFLEEMGRLSLKLENIKVSDFNLYTNAPQAPALVPAAK